MRKILFTPPLVNERQEPARILWFFFGHDWERSGKSKPSVRLLSWQSSDLIRRCFRASFLHRRLLHQPQRHPCLVDILPRLQRRSPFEEKAPCRTLPTKISPPLRRQDIHCETLPVSYFASFASSTVLSVICLEVGFGSAASCAMNVPTCNMTRVVSSMD